jgi:tetratricopeptide (TPR) repeat protein
MGAVRAARAGDENPIPWIARTLERASVYGRAHLLLARMLQRRSPAQARLEYRLAMEQDYNLIQPAIAEGSQLVQSGDDALQLIPDDPRLTDMVLEQLATRLRPTRPAAAERLDQELARRNPASPVVARLAWEKTLSSLKSDPACGSDRARCLATAMAAAERYREVSPTNCPGHRAVAEIVAESGDLARAFADLDRAMDAMSDRGPCAQYLVDLATRMNDDRRVSMALERSLAAACATDAECAAALLHAAQVEEGRKNSRRALAHAKRAHDRSPERNDILAVVARLTAATGDHAGALEIYQTLQGREPANPAWPQKAAAERAAMDAARRRVLGIEPVTP